MPGDRDPGPRPSGRRRHGAGRASIPPGVRCPAGRRRRSRDRVAGHAGGVHISRRGQDYTEAEVAPGYDPELVLQAALKAWLQVLHFEIADPSLEEIFKSTLVRSTLATTLAPRRRTHERLAHSLPNAWYVAAREYRSRASSRSFRHCTILLAGRSHSPRRRLPSSSTRRWLQPDADGGVVAPPAFHPTS